MKGLVAFFVFLSIEFTNSMKAQAVSLFWKLHVSHLPQGSECKQSQPVGSHQAERRLNQPNYPGSHRSHEPSFRALGRRNFCSPHYISVLYGLRRA